MKFSTALPGVALFFAFTLLSGCEMDDSSQMSKSQQRQVQSIFKSIQKSQKNLLAKFKQDSVSMPKDMKTLYLQIQKMHQQMSENHRHMMSGHQKKDMGMQQDNKQMKKRRQMRRRIQNKMSREWYSQMQSMHRQMAQVHGQMNHSERAKQHRQIGEKYGEIMNLIPKANEPEEELINEKGNPAILNGANLYAQHCAPCHGSNAQGIGNVFPPLVNSKWITGEKSVPVRIVRDGLSGNIQVDGVSYSGTMPPFKARLSTTEIAAIINYLRDKSSSDYSQITQEDVIEISKTYQNRKTPWQPNELLDD